MSESLLIDRFGRPLAPTKSKEPEELEINGLKLSEIKKFDLVELEGLQASLMEDGKITVSKFNEDEIREDDFRSQINLVIANLGVVEVLIKEKKEAEATVEVVGNIVNK